MSYTYCFLYRIKDNSITNFIFFPILCQSPMVFCDFIAVVTLESSFWDCRLAKIFCANFVQKSTQQPC